MSIGLRSANRLAGELDEFFAGKKSRTELQKSYDIFWKKEFAARIKLSRHFQKLSEFPLLSGLTIGTFNLFPGLAKMAIRQTHGDIF